MHDPGQTFPRLQETGCLSLIGMAGAGKSTLGRLLAEKLGWAHLDTDRLIEAYYGLTLQGLLEGLGRSAFMQAEEQLVSMLGVRRAVVSTGGSVIYGPAAVQRLKLLGPVVFLDISLPTFLARVGDASHRGLAIAPGLSHADLFRERQPLYQAAADFTLNTDTSDCPANLTRLLAWLAQEPEA